MIITYFCSEDAMSSDLIQVRVPSEMKAEAEAVFSGIGLKTGDAIRVFLQQCINKNGLPFMPETKTPNAETLEAMRDSDEGRGHKTTLAELRAEMGLAPK
jgi:DNA-damage-inducible protein J